MNATNKWKNMAGLYIGWLLASTIAFSLISAVAFFVGNIGESGFFLILFTALPIWVIGLGLVQARLLRQKAGGMVLWIFVVACYVPIIGSTLNFNDSSSSLPAFIAGGILGVIQFFVLRKRTPEAILWIPASMLAWGISYIIGYRFFSIFGGAFYLIAVGVINGIVTGIPYTISFSQLKLGALERIALVIISILSLGVIWLSVNAGLNREDSTFAISRSPEKIEFSPNSRLLAIAYSNGIEFRSTDSWQVIGSITFKSEDRYINEMNFSPDGKTIAVALCCEDNVVELWDSTNFQYIETLSGHVNDVYTVAFSPDGRLVASGGKGKEPDAQVIVWNFASKEIVRVIDFPQQMGGNRGVQRVEISPDNKLLGVSVPWGTGQARVIFVDVASGDVIRQIDGFNDPLFKASFSKDWKYLAGASGKTIKVFDVSTGQQLSSISLETEYFSFSLINNVLIENSEKNMLRVWNVENGVMIVKLFPAPDFSITTVSPDSKWIVSAYQGDYNSDCRRNCTVRVWNLEKYYP